MKRELTPVQRQWVEALRSGKYKQGKESLRRGDRFCCLGVLCELAVQHGVIDPAEDDEYDGVDTYLPESVREWAGLRTDHGELHHSEYPSLADANDHGKRFKTIAKLIEQHADELFVEAQP